MTPDEDCMSGVREGDSLKGSPTGFPHPPDRFCIDPVPNLRWFQGRPYLGCFDHGTRLLCGLTRGFLIMHDTSHCRLLLVRSRLDGRP